MKCNQHYCKIISILIAAIKIVHQSEQNLKKNPKNSIHGSVIGGTTKNFNAAVILFYRFQKYP